MAFENNQQAVRLLRAFGAFHKADWQGNSINGMKHSDIQVLMVLRFALKQGTLNMKVSEISQRLRVTSPTVTQLVKGLEAQGMVERHSDQEDRRAVRVKLTESGEAAAKKAMESLVSSFNGLIAHLGEEDSEKLAELLIKTFEYYEAKHRQDNQSRWMEEDKA